MKQNAKQLLQSTHLSHSRLQTYEQCPQRFKLQYLDGHESAPSSEMQLGSVVHAVLADYLQAIQGRPQVFEPSQDDLSARVPGVCRALRDEGALVTEVNPYKVAPMLANFVRMFPRIDGRAILHVESEQRSRLGAYTLLSILDLVLVNERRGVHIIDFKTGKPKYVKDDQLRTYSLPILGSDEHNGTPVQASYVFLREGTIRSSTISPNEREGIVSDIMAVVSTIERDEHFHPHVTRLCAWCGVKKWCSKFRLER